ncbi:MAG: hypothetical protein AAF750_10530 [Planctomycetota bacterium]
MTLQEKLWALHLVDANIRGLRSRLDAAARRKTALSRKLDHLRQQHTELEQQHKTHAAHAATLESEANGVEGRIESLRQRMNSVTSNKEYSALLVEVNTLKADKSKIEDRSLEGLTKVDELTEQLAELAAEVEKQQKLVDAAGAEVVEAESEIAGRLSELEAERSTAASEVPDEPLRAYDKLNEDYDGEALAEIEEYDRKRMEYHCGACNTRLPIEKVNATLTSTDEIYPCPFCDKLLIAKDRLREGIAGSK